MGGDWLKTLELSGNKAFLVFVAAALVSFGHERELFSLGSIPGPIAGGINVAAILFGTLSLPWVFECAAGPLRRLGRQRNRKKSLERTLSSLTVEEALVLLRMVVADNQHTFADLHRYSGSVGHMGLYRRGLLVANAEVGQGYSMSIPDDFWKEIRAEREGANEALERLEAQARSAGLQV